MNKDDLKDCLLGLICAIIFTAAGIYWLAVILFISSICFLICSLTGED